MRGLGVHHDGRDGHAPDGTDLDARLGRILAITGPSGAGKTTLLSVLLGVRHPDVGTVTVVGGGRQALLDELDLAQWRAQLAWVDQSPYLFAGTIADNVRLARPDAPDHDLRDALDAAGLTAMSADLLVGEGGRTLSAGERRRVAIARAVLRDAPLVLLDEPTAGLDADTEHEVLDAVRRLASTSIVIMVSHRPAAVAIADDVVEVRAAAASPASSMVLAR